MAIASAVVGVPFGLLFLLSGLTVNIFQAICFVFIRPFSKTSYRKINRVVAELLWVELVWLLDWWAHVKIELYMDPEEFKFLGKEHALFISNHRSDVDWLVGWVLAQRSGCLGSALAVMKKSSKYLPVVGWSFWFSEYVFLERSWAKDENTLKSGFKRLEDFPRPFWLALFVEGTRFTKAKLLAAQEYATSAGLPVPRNTLIPRTKGFVSAVTNMRSFVPAVYDATVSVPKSQPSPTILRLLKAQSSVIHVHLKRHPMTELPETEDGIAKWCRDAFVVKDALLDKHLAEGTFGDQEVQDIGRSKKPLLVVLSWSCLLVLAAVKLFQSSSFLSSRKGVAFVAGFLIIVTALVQFFIIVSQSEHSTPAKVPAAKAMNGAASETNREKLH